MLKIGHRGACGYEPENTLRSFQKAIELGVDMIECDVHLSKDRQLVVIHDFAVEASTNGQGRVADLTYDQIMELDAGAGEIVPTLEEVLDLVRGKCRLNVEVKDPDAVEPVIKLVKNREMVRDVTISLWHANAIYTVRRTYTDIKLAYVFWKAKTHNGQGLRHALARAFLPITKLVLKSKIHTSGTNVVSLSKYLATKGMVKMIHNAGAEVWVWTVDDPKMLDRVKSYKVDGIISNYPDRI